MHAPNLTVQGGQYLLGQLRNFARGVRGGPQSFYGWQMNGRAKALPDDRAFRDVVFYIDSLPKVRSKAMVRGDSVRGKAAYVGCIGCHGEKAQGKVEVAGPALAGLDDGYLAEQLRAYVSGERGAHKDDAGAQMRAAALTLRSDESIRDVVAYIDTLP